MRKKSDPKKSHPKKSHPNEHGMVATQKMPQRIPKLLLSGRLPHRRRRQ